MRDTRNPEPVPSWAVDDRRLQLIVAVRRLAASIRSSTIEALSEHNLLPVHGAALLAIRAEQPCTHARLAQMCDLERPNATPVINLLVDHGWVQRSRSSEDGRVWLLELTPAGSKLARTVSSAWSDIAATLTEGLNDRAQQQLLTQLVAANERFRFGDARQDSDSS